MASQSNQMENHKVDKASCRRPTTRKAIKFFGTAISFDEQLTMRSNSIKHSAAKFIRTQSFGVLSPKKSLYKRITKAKHHTNCEEYKDDTATTSQLFPSSISSLPSSSTIASNSKYSARDKNYNFDGVECNAPLMVLKESTISPTTAPGLIKPLSKSILDMVYEMDDSDSTNDADENNDRNVVHEYSEKNNDNGDKWQNTAGDYENEIGKIVNCQRKLCKYDESTQVFCDQMNLMRATTMRSNRILCRYRQQHKIRSRSASCDAFDGNRAVDNDACSNVKRYLFHFLPSSFHFINFFLLRLYI